MKKGCLTFVLSVIILGMLGALYDDFRHHYEYQFPERELTLLKFKKDSFDLRKMLGDSFSISNHNFGQMRDGKLFVYRIKNIPNAEQPHFDIPVFDVRAKKILGIYDILAEPYKLRYPLIDFYRDTLYISSSDSFYEVLAIDTKTGMKSYIPIDPCNQAPGAGQILRTGSNLFILGKPYGIGVINWENKLCRETFPNPSIEGGGVKLPVGNEINLLRTHQDKMNNVHYAVYDSKGKILWKYQIPNNPKYYLRNTQESFYIAKEENTLRFLDKYTGKEKGSVILNIDKEFFIHSLRKDSLIIGIDNPKKSTSYTLYYLKNMKPIWTKVIPFFEECLNLENVFITFNTIEDYKTERKNSKRIERIYSRKNFDLLSERTLYTERKYRLREDIHTSSLDIRDIATDDNYYLHNGVLYW